MAPPGKYTLSNHSSLPAEIRDSMTNILKNWDDNDSNNAYLSYFTPNATVNFGGTKIGRDAIRAARDGMIHATNGPIVQCTHVFDSGFVNPEETKGDEGGEILIKGTVTYELKNGKKVVSPVISLGRFVRGVDEEWCQAEFYEVFMDPTELWKAIGEMMGKEGGS
jgi:hypothetical protein